MPLSARTEVAPGRLHQLQHVAELLRRQVAHQPQELLHQPQPLALRLAGRAPRPRSGSVHGRTNEERSSWPIERV